MNIQQPTPEELDFFGKMAQRDLEHLIQTSKSNVEQNPELKGKVSTLEGDLSYHSGKATVAFSYFGVYAIVKTMPPQYLSIEGQKLNFEANGVAFGAGFGGAFLVGRSAYTAQEIAAFGEVHIHFSLISNYCCLNMWTVPMAPIGAWRGPNTGAPISGGTFGANCAISLKS